MIDVVPAVSLGEERRMEIAEVFVDGYSKDFAGISKDRAKLRQAFAHMLRLEVFHVGLVDGTPAGIAALTNGQQLCVQHDPAELRRHLGMLKGSFTSMVFRREFEQSRPEPLPADHASIEFVATAERFRGRGVASAILRHFLDLPDYRTYLIEEVADNNETALRVYRRLGFVEYRRHPVRAYIRVSGIKAYVSLRLTQNQAEHTDAADQARDSRT